ncbi:hypothetical protein K491DRAFT_660866 [Lophiostoma macrostomum CBS 122681]|uniref:Glycoside hydrolase family 131 protein n=1 Tax=Lophiostoma macrostomum CBS 122681 TaxID=1314788 RepID=A0A6A6T5C4_9PLEO|nr:hypothetical protein K491DRAFT_660866 [Lophiostoma macrostomum CBS 122681]
MLSRYLRHATLAAALADFTLAAKTSKIVPQSLQSAFESSDVDIQVSYTGDAVDGFLDGTSFSKDEVTDEPTFALGDSSAISSTALFTVLMVDVTEDGKNVLHYARPNFIHTEIVEIGSDSKALQAYKAPGSFGETGDDRKYIFLLYNNPKRDEVSTLKLPSEGDTFDAQQFQDDNGFEAPQAGIGMVVNLGGNSGGGNDGTASTTIAQGGSSAASSAASSASSSAAPSSTAAPEASTTAADSATTTVVTATQSDVPVSTTAVASQASSEGNSPSTTAAVSQSSSDLAAASSVVAGNSTAASTLVLSSIAPDGTGSPTTSGSPAQQTANGASGLMLGTTSCAIAVSLMALVGLLAW